MSPTDLVAQTALPAHSAFELIATSRLETVSEAEKLAYFKSGLLMRIHLFLNTSEAPKKQEIALHAWQAIHSAASTQELLSSIIDTLHKTLSFNLLAAHKSSSKHSLATKLNRMFSPAKQSTNWLDNNFQLATQIADILFNIFHYPIDNDTHVQIKQERDRLLVDMRRSNKEGFPDPLLAILMSYIEPKIKAYISDEKPSHDNDQASIPGMVRFR